MEYSNFVSHVNEVVDAINILQPMALEKIGIKAEKYAKALAPVGTPESTGIPGYIGGTLRNSITHEVVEDAVYVGTNVEYAPYQELGTRYMPPTNHGKGYLRPAVEDHISLYNRIASDTMKGVV